MRFMDWLLLLLVTLKLCGVITVSWWIVTAPLWGPLLFALTLLLFVKTRKGG